MKKEAVVASALIRNLAGLVLVFVFEGQDEVAFLPGGSREKGETPVETAIRESFEETGLRVNVEKLVTFYNLVVFNKDGHEKCRFLHYLFLASTTDSDPRPSSEWRDSKANCRWTTLEGLGRYRKVWPLPEEVRRRISKGKLDLGDMGELKYQTE